MESNMAWYILTIELSIGVQKCGIIPRIIGNNISQIIIPQSGVVKSVSVVCRDNIKEELMWSIRGMLVKFGANIMYPNSLLSYR